MHKYVLRRLPGVQVFQQYSSTGQSLLGPNELVSHFLQAFRIFTSLRKGLVAILLHSSSCQFSLWS